MDNKLKTHHNTENHKDAKVNQIFKNIRNAQRYSNYKLKTYLFKNSAKFFLMFLLSSTSVISIYENTSWLSLLVRVGFIVLFSSIVFLINIGVIAYYKSAQELTGKPKSFQKNVFATGFIITFFLFWGFHHILIWLQNQNIDLELPASIQLDSTWKIILFVFYLSLIHYTFIFLIQNFTLTEYEKSQVEIELLKLKSANTDTTIHLLKQQIQPHFLFNALNTLKSLIKKRPDTAEDYLIRLSDFLRASFSNKKSLLSSVLEELTICANYMEMQKIRFGEAIRYAIDIPDDVDTKNIFLPVFSLQPLLENAIKHNSYTNENPLYIYITKENGYVFVTNNLQYKKVVEESTGSGLSNLKERYKIISGDDVHISVVEGVHRVGLKILEDQ